MIYTCYFSGLGGRTEGAVSICLQQPPGFRLPVASELCPPFGMLWKFMKGKLSRKRFSQIYTQRFDILDPQEIAQKYDGKILVAWEGYEDRMKTIPKFSHRYLLSDWLKANGVEVEELDPLPPRKKIGF